MWLVAIQFNGKCKAVDSLVSLASADSDACLSCWLELILCSLVSLASADSNARLSCWLEYTHCSLVSLDSDASLSCWLELICYSLVSLASDDSAARRSLVACSLVSLLSSLGSHLIRVHLALFLTLRFLSLSSLCSAISEVRRALSYFRRR